MMQVKVRYEGDFAMDTPNATEAQKLVSSANSLNDHQPVVQL